MLVVMFTVGSVDQVANSATGLPIIEIYYQTTRGVHATSVLVAMMALILFSASLNIFTSVSQLVWAFARDDGLCFSSLYSNVSDARPCAGNRGRS